MSPSLGKASLIWLSLLLCQVPLPTSAGDKEPHYIYGQDMIELVDIKALDEEIEVQGQAKLVIFSSKFCEACELFEDTLKDLITRTRRWSHVLSVYFFDCTREGNPKICQSVGVKEEPTLRYFGPKYNQVRDTTGMDIPSRNYSGIVADLATQLSMAEFGPLGNRTIPNFEPIQYRDIKNPFGGNALIQTVVFVYHPPENTDTFAIETILDLAPYPYVRVRIVNDKAILGDLPARPERGLKRTEDSTIFVLHRSGKWDLVKTRRKGKEDNISYVEAVETILHSEGHPVIGHPAYEIIGIGATYSYEQATQEIGRHVLRGPVRVYRADLELAVWRLLYKEIPRTELIQGQKFVVLKNFITVLRKINPLNLNGQTLINHIHKVLAEWGGADSDYLMLMVDSFGRPTLTFQTRHYVGCISSRPFLREYLCSLWTLFHFLTVEGAKRPQPFRAGFVLETIHGIIEHFLYDCPACSGKYLALQKKEGKQSIQTHDEEIYELWKLHNIFNDQLAHKLTEDPMFPKIQFPSKESCGNCRNGQQWVRGNVIAYLKRIYDMDNLSFYGMTTARGYRRGF